MVKQKIEKVLKKKEVSVLDFKHLDINQLSDALEINIRTIARWKSDYDPPLPANMDNTFSLAKVFEWYTQREVSRVESQLSGDLDKKKIAAQIENLKRDALLKEEKIKTLQSQCIQVDTHEKIIESIFGSLKSFLTETLQINAHHFVNKGVDEIRILFSQLALEASSEITSVIKK